MLKIITTPTSMVMETGNSIRSLLPMHRHHSIQVVAIDKVHPWNGKTDVKSLQSFLAPRLQDAIAKKKWDAQTVIAIPMVEKDQTEPGHWMAVFQTPQGNHNVADLSENNILNLHHLDERMRIPAFVFGGYRDALQKRWVESQLPTEKFDDWWKKMTEVHRRYHTPVHIHQMISLFDAWKEEMRNPLAVLIAIFFHDLVMETRKKDFPHNEEQSAAFLWAWLAHAPSEWRATKPGTPSLLGMAAEMIIATKNHEISDWMRTHPGCIHDAQIFLDIDMSVLACRHGLYSYENAISMEWKHAEKEEYKEGRSRFLAGLLARKRVFLSDLGYVFESTAKEQIADLLNKVQTS